VRRSGAVGVGRRTECTRREQITGQCGVCWSQEDRPPAEEGGVVCVVFGGVVSASSESRLAGESQSCAKGGLEGCSQAQVVGQLGLVRLVCAWDWLQGRARAHERWMMDGPCPCGAHRQWQSWNSPYWTHLRLRRSISRACSNYSRDSVCVCVWKGERFHGGCFGVNNNGEDVSVRGRLLQLRSR